MAKTSKNTTWEDPNPTKEDLKSTIELIDGFSQEGFSQISSIARLLIISLETPEGHKHIDTLVNGLKTIKGKADDIENCINAEAERVGCNHKDTSISRCYDARNQAQAERINWN